MKIHHVGYLCKNIEKSVEHFKALEFVPEGSVVYDANRDIDILFMTNGDYRIELVAPKTKESVVYDTFKKLGTTPYHICYCCENIKAKQKELSEQGYTTISDIAPAPAINGSDVCFMLNARVGIIELVECSV